MFENIAGHENIKKILSNNINTKNILHSYLFIGEEGIGKKMLAKEFAKAILCNSENNRPCNTCKSCVEFNTNNNANFNLIKEEGRAIKIEQIRNMQVKIAEKPINSDYKVYLINDAELMTQEAQNCLLKTLEEPPEYTVIILIGSNENLFLTTIKSRCMILHFDKISNEEMKRYLKYNLEINQINEEMLDMFQGSIGKAINLKDKQEEYKSIYEFIENLGKVDLIELYNYAKPIYKFKEEIFEVLDYINILLLKKAKQQYIYADCINIVEETKKRLKQNGNYDMCIDNMIFNLKDKISNI